MSDDIRQHTGNKYLRLIRSALPGSSENAQVDVYAVLEAYAVACPAAQHAIKKLLCAGLRDKGTRLADLKEARDSCTRAIQLEEGRQ